jgi:hypothetical protein
MTESVTTVPASNKMPRSVLWLGALGLLPFVAASLLAVIAPSIKETAVAALIAYGAVILSFLGGALWGLIIGRADADRMGGLLILSVVPSLIGWVSLLLPPVMALVLLALSSGCWFVVDTRMAKEKIAPPWYPRLRMPLTVIVVCCLALAVFFNA